MRSIDTVTEEEIDQNLAQRSCARRAKSKLYKRGELVVPTDRYPYSGAPYVFVTSIRWEPYGGLCSYGGYLLLNPRTGKLASSTNIRRFNG